MASAAAASASAAAASAGISPVSATEGGVDESLYSRQLYVLGHEAQQRLSESSVLLCGLSSLGVEVAKNVALAGVRSLQLLDDALVTEADAGSNFCVTPSHWQQRTSRAAAALPAIAALNPYVAVSLLSGLSELQALQGDAFSCVVLVSAPLAVQLQVDAYCRQHSVRLVCASACGLLASVFVDVGPEFTVSDPTGEPLRRGLISHISQSAPGVVTCHEEHRHGLQDGDLVRFEEVEGMTPLNSPPCPPRPVRVLSPFSFAIEDTSALPAYSGHGGYFQQVQRSVAVSCQSLEAQLLAPSLLHEFTCERELYALWLGLEDWRQQRLGGAELPCPLPPEAVSEVMQLTVSRAAQLRPPVQLPAASLSLLSRLARVSGCLLAPVCSFVGGVVGQEVLKAVTGKFTPLQQLFIYDGSHALPEQDGPAEESSRLPARYLHAATVFGPAFQRLLASLHYFVVGAGAIGCELLKLLALMGAGRVTVTDMDAIERSNLNRQFLFRAADVGQLKATVAAREAGKLNPDCRIASHELRVGPGSEDVYDDGFWQSLDGVLTALDNVEARLYLDQRCVYQQRAMIDSGTLGAKGSVQVVVPHLTQSYAASRDPPEESVPLCTLRSFPNRIEHCIQWARDWFEGAFSSPAAAVNAFLQQGVAFIDETRRSKPGELLPTLRLLHSALCQERPRDFADCVRWARVQFELEFAHKISQLLFVFPAEARTAEGLPFWSAAKRQPSPLVFSLDDPLHRSFVCSAAHLRAVHYGLPLPASARAEEGAVTAAVGSASLPPLQLGAVKIATTDAEAKAMAEEKTAAMQDEEDGGQQAEAEALTEQLRGFLQSEASRPSLAAVRALAFDKDDDSNGHVAFVTAASNLRARNYRLREESRHVTKQIAGKIIPAIATTTAAVTGLVCLELYKLAARHLSQRPQSLALYRNSSINLALPLLLTGAEPLPPAAAVARFPAGEWRWTQWGPHRGERGPRPDAGRAAAPAVRALRRGDEHAVVRRGDALLLLRQQEEDEGAGQRPHLAARAAGHRQGAAAAPAPHRAGGLRQQRRGRRHRRPLHPLPAPV